MPDVNKLDHLLEFQALLGAYSISAEHRKLLESLKLVLLLGPTATGRNTVIRELIKTGDYHYIVSDTTRKPRRNDGILEQNGVEYWFKTEEEVLEGLRLGNYLEAEVIHGQQVSGIHIDELRRAKNEDRIAINEVDIAGVENVVAAKPDTKPILLLPPSFEEWQRRIKKRGEPEPTEYKRRMQTALKIFTLAIERSDQFYLLVNDTIAKTVEHIQLIASDEDIKHASQEQAFKPLQDCLVKTEQLLAQLG